MLAEITTLATELDVSIADIEIAHSAEGREGVLIVLVEAELGPRLVDGLMAAGFKPVVALVAMTAPRRVEPLTQPFDLTVELPGSKSLTNRALICAALADGKSTLTGALFADDTEAMLDSLQRLGATVVVDRRRASHRRRGHEGSAVCRSASSLDARLSGTTSRFLLPLLAIGVGPYRLDGLPPLRARPMADGLHSAAAARCSA